jgi:hypothetical protein
MKKALFFYFCLFFLIISCQKNNQDLALDSGKINSISVIVDDKLWDGEVGDSIRNKFASPVIGLPQEEPLFTLNQFPVKLFEGFRNNSRNIIVIKKENKTDFILKNNQFSKPQNIFYISGKTSTEIIEILEQNYPSIIKKIRQTEIEQSQARIDTLSTDIGELEKKFNIQLKIPIGYKLVSKKNNFLWFKKEITSGNLSLLVYQTSTKMINPQRSIVEEIKNNRDSIGKLYIHGRSRNTNMHTEDSYSPYLTYTVLDKRYTYQTRGTWEMENDFMTGPFVNYSILDKPNKRILVLEGFCYAPSKEKRDLMFELESIIKTIKFDNPKTKK